MTRIPDGDLSMEAALQHARRLPETFQTGSRQLTPREVVATLEPMMSAARVDRLKRVVAGRAQGVAVVVDGLANTGNVAAVMRSAEGLGYLRMHMVIGQAPYKHSTRTSQGAEKWLDINIWDSPAACAEALRGLGYRIVATHLDEASQPIGDFDFTRPTALVFGNELGGISRDMLKLADATCVIPMGGFTQSFNISVAAATCLYHAREDRMRRRGAHGDLDEHQQEWLMAAYCMRSVAESQGILDRTFGQPSFGQPSDRK